MYCVFTRIIIRNLGLIYFKTEVPILLTIENAYSEDAFFFIVFTLWRWIFHFANKLASKLRRNRYLLIPCNDKLIEELVQNDF